MKFVKMKNFIAGAKKELSLLNFGLHCDEAESFVLCQWQRGRKPSVWYLTYRFTMATYFFITLVLSICKIGGSKDGSPPEKWPIYLTNWGLTMYCLQASLACVLLFCHWQNETEGNTEEKKKAEFEMTWIVRLYWVLHTIAVTAGFAITGTYWVLIYNPAVNKNDFLSIMAHILNSIFMGIDLCMVKHPYRLLHFYWPLCFSTSYIAFSVIYYLAGGTGRLEEHRIYSVLDWDQPIKTAVLCAGCTLYVLITHTIVWILYSVRQTIYHKVIPTSLPEPNK